MENKTPVTVESTVNAPVEKVWDYFTNPDHITKWNTPSEDWHSPRSENDLRSGGKFSTRMEAKDGSMGFDFGGVYDDVQEHKLIDYTLSDGRKVQVRFSADESGTHVVETFDPEDMNPVEFQKAGWQAIMDNFKKYTESH